MGNLTKMIVSIYIYIVINLLTDPQPSVNEFIFNFDQSLMQLNVHYTVYDCIFFSQARVVGKKDKKVKEKRIFGGKSSADGKLNKRKNDDDDAALKARPILNEKNKADDLVVDDNTVKPLKMSEKEKVNRIASKIKKLYKIKARKNIPDETKLSSAADGMNNSRKSVVKNKKSVSLENNYFEGAQEMKNNSKSGDSMEHPYVSMKKKLNKCTKEIDQFVGKVTNLFQKKSSKSK